MLIKLSNGLFFCMWDEEVSSSASVPYRHCEKGVARRSNSVFDDCLLDCFVGRRPSRNDDAKHDMNDSLGRQPNDKTSETLNSQLSKHSGGTALNEQVQTFRLILRRLVLGLSALVIVVVPIQSQAKTQATSLQAEKNKPTVSVDRSSVKTQTNTQPSAKAGTQTNTRLSSTQSNAQTNPQAGTQSSKTNAATSPSNVEKVLGIQQIPETATAVHVEKNRVLVTVHQRNGQIYRKSLVRYQANWYRLAYKTFLASGNLNDAFVVAMAAVHQRPNHSDWRFRLARVSEWDGQPVLALSQWLYLLKKPNYHEQASAAAFRLAKALYDDRALAHLYHLKIQAGDNSETAWGGYIQALEKLGRPEVAIRALQRLPKETLARHHLTHLARLYVNLGKYQLAKPILEQPAQEQHEPLHNALQRAEIAYTRGDIDAAYQQLQRVTVSPDVHPRYWTTLGLLAWLKQRNDVAKHAYLTVYRYHRRWFDEDMFSKLIELTQRTQPQFALKLAFEGQRRFKSYDFLYQALNVVSAQESVALLSALMNRLTPEHRHQLNAFPEFWVLRATLAEKLGERAKAIAIIETALRRWPTLAGLQAQYLQLLAANKSTERLRYALSRYQPRLIRQPEYYSALAAAYRALHEWPQALQLYTQELQRAPRRYQTWVEYADVLKHAYPTYDVRPLRERAWRLLNATVARQRGRMNAEEKQTYLNLSEYFAPETIHAGRVYGLLNGKRNQEAAETAGTWALEHQQYDLGEQIHHQYVPRNQAKAQALELKLAKSQYDMTAMQDLLAADVGGFDLPAVDRIESAQRVGNIRLAQQYAYEGLLLNPFDGGVYQQLTEAMLKAVNTVQLKQVYKNLEVLQGPESVVTAKVFAEPSLEVGVQGKLWILTTDDPTVITGPPNTDGSVVILVKKFTDRGFVAFTGGYRHALAGFFNAKLDWLYRISDGLDSLLTLGVNQPALASTALLIGGMEDDITWVLNNKLTKHDELALSVMGRYFFGQNGVGLGYGGVAEAFYHHQFWMSFPDWGMNVWADANSFTLNGRLSGVLNRLIPAGTLPSVSFYIPRGYAEVGVTVGFGRRYLEEYTHSWKPYLNIGALESSTTGLGPIINLGLVGSVFGRDHLLVFFEYSKNSQSGGRADYKVGLSYNLYFS